VINYRAILLYYSKGNTNTQIATICGCSRTTVIKTIKRAQKIKLALPVADSIKDKELYLMLYPNRGRNHDYYMPDFYLLDKDRRKRGFSIYRAWQKYCRVAKREGYKAYQKSKFYELYKERFSCSEEHAIISENLNKIAGYDILRLFIARNKISELAAKNIEEEISLWCKQLRLDENKIWNPDEKI